MITVKPSPMRSSSGNTDSTLAQKRTRPISIPTPILGFLTSDLTTSRIYAAVSSLIWAIVIVNSSKVDYDLNWSFMNQHMDQSSFSALLFLLTGAQLFILNVKKSTFAVVSDLLIYSAYTAVWVFSALNVLFYGTSVITQTLVGGHVILSLLGMWIIIRGFSSFKTL